MKIKVLGDNRKIFRSYETVDHIGFGETANVYSAFAEAQKVPEVDTVIKLAKELKFNEYIKREFDVLVDMRKVDNSGANYLPTDIALGVADDGRNALIMKPILKETLNQVIGKSIDKVERGKLALRAAKQYVELIDLIVSTGRSCQDKKLSDFWWVGNSTNGKMIVTDWNVIADSANQLLDIRRFGLIWYELIMGRQLKQGIVLTRDDYDLIPSQPGYGLYYLIGRCIGSSIGPQFSTTSELSQFVNELSRLYDMPALRLVNDATEDLRSLESRNDISRAKADMAWIKFDIANLREGGYLKELDNSKGWAKHPLEQFIPTLFQIFKSPNFSNVRVPIDQLKMYAQGNQEIGDIDRLEFIFDTLNSVKTRHLLGSEEFRIVQINLADMGKALLSPIKNIRAASESIQNISPIAIIDPAFKEQISVLELEIQFWEKYYSLEEDALAGYFNQLIDLRQSIFYLPRDYSPSADTLRDEKDAALSRLKLKDISNQTVAQNSIIERSYRKRLPLSFDRHGQWEEVVLQLAHLRMDYMHDLETRDDWQKAVSELRDENQRLASERITPRIVEARDKILSALLRESEKFPEDIPDRSEIKEAYDKLIITKEKIRMAQKDFFKDQEHVLQEASSGGYEIFDSPELSVTTLMTIFEIDKKFIEFEGRSRDLDTYKDYSIVIEKNIKDLKKIKEKYLDWKDSVPDGSENFFIKTLGLYFNSCYMLLDNGDDISETLDRAKTLLDFLSKTNNTNSEFIRYKEIYSQLQSLKGKNLNFKKLEEVKRNVESQIVKVKFLEWFHNGNFDEIKNNLREIYSADERTHWERILEEKSKFEGAKFVTENRLDQTERKKRSEMLAKALQTLRDLARSNSEIYSKYKEEIQNLYEHAWRRLNEEDKNLSNQFEKDIRS
ncbi:MAG: hypothetical protein WBW94_04470 [Anaerolineales bacterium]